MKYKFLFPILIFFLFWSCTQEQQTTNSIILKQKSVPLEIDCGTKILDYAYFLNAEQCNFLIKSLKNVKGKPFSIPINLPEDWLVECKIETFSPYFDIWLIVNEGEASIKMLATVLPDTNIFIDAIPIAFNWGIESNRYVESEYWQSTIDAEYHIFINKAYEKLYSLTENGREEQPCISNNFEDEFIIDDNGYFNFIEKPTFDIDYMAIIQFADTAKLTSSLDENWIWNAISIQEQIEPLNILFTETVSDFDIVSIYDYSGELVDIIDVSHIVNQENFGYIAYKKGKEPLFISYDTPINCLNKALFYFELPQISIETEGEEESIVVENN